MKNIKSFITALKAEHIKKQGTGTYILGMILSSIPAVIGFISSFFNILEEPPVIPYNFYEQYIGNLIQAFGGFFFPLAIIIAVSKIAQLDHKNNGWQLMEIQPMSKFSIYFSKFTVALIHNALCIVWAVATLLIAGWLSTFVSEPPKVAEFSIPFGYIFQLVVRLFTASLLLTIVQYIISVLISGFVWSIVIGFFGLVLSLFLIPMKVSPEWNPFSIILKSAEYESGSEIGRWFLFTEKIGFVLFLAVAVIGFLWYKYKTVKRAFFAPKRLILVIVTLIFGFGLTAYLLSPNSMEARNRTVIAGKIHSDRNFKQAFFIDIFTNDTLNSFSIKNNEFNALIDTNLPLGRYGLIIGTEMPLQKAFVMKTNDSIFLDIKSYSNKTNMKIYGTRLAENQSEYSLGVSWNYDMYILENRNDYLDKPEKAAEIIYEAWKDDYKSTQKFKTRDNFVPRADYAKIREKDITAYYLNKWYDFLKKRKAIEPKAVFEKVPGKIAELQKKLTLTDEELLMSSDYLQYVTAEITRTDTTDTDQKTKEIKAIAALENGNFKNRLLFSRLQTALEEATSAEERKTLITEYVDKIQNEKLKRLAVNHYKTQERIAKGNPAPEFTAQNLEGKTVKLSDFKGKYVLIDVWATWCGPCKEEAPYFEKEALKYKKENVVFVALSIDSQKDKWFLDAKTKSKQIVQLHLDRVAADEFTKNYNLTGIPRFLFINPKGEFISSQMARPSNNSLFEMLLNNEFNKEKKE